MGKSVLHLAVVVVVTCMVGSTWAAKKEKPEGAKKAPNPAKAFAAKDKDKSGTLSVDEFVGKHKGDKKARAEKRFAKLDADGNDELTLAEFSVGMGKGKDKPGKDKKKKGDDQQ